MVDGAFTGFPADGLQFFTELEANNNRTWWHENKSRFESSVRGPMRALLDELEPSYGIFRSFRPNRDTRFSKDKSPYKTAHAAMTETEGGSSLYIQLGANGLFIGAGMYHPMKDQLERMRAAIDDDRTGPALAQAVKTVRQARIDVGPGHDAPLKTAPRGYDSDHPRIELLRWKGVIAGKELGAPKWLNTRRAVQRVSQVWDTAAPLIDWLDANVGPSEVPPDR